MNFVYFCELNHKPSYTRMKYGFDNEKYIRIQSEKIKERIAQFKGKLYLELGGKLFDDHHASRVLPGFQPDSKLRMLQQLADSAEIVIVISAIDIEKNKIRQDLGITYDEDVLRLRNEFQNRGFLVNNVVITHYNGQSSADQYRRRLESMGIKAYYHYTIEGYPHNVDLIDSDEGFGKDDYVETTQPLVIVTAPGPGSGKMAVCLSQLYNEHKRGVEAGYAKFETFPVWNLPLKHPINIAYEAATADLNDVNMIDPFHMEAYEICKEASLQEIVRRYYTALSKLALGACNENEVTKLKLLFKQAKIDTDYRKCTVAAKARQEETGVPCSAIELEDGHIITASSSPLLGTCASLLLNATKHLAGIDHSIKLISQDLIEPIQKTKTEYLGGHNPRLHTDEVLVALSVLSQNDANCRRALAMLPLLKGCQAHSTVMISEVDQKIFKKLGIGLTCDPVQKETL